jgi:hypothetical protein
VGFGIGYLDFTVKDFSRRYKMIQYMLMEGDGRLRVCSWPGNANEVLSD